MPKPVATEGPADAKVALLKKLDLLAKSDTLSQKDKLLLMNVSDDEIVALSTFVKKVGGRRSIRKCKRGPFPHPDTVGF